MVWANLGINYSSTGRAATSFASDMAYLRALGFTRVRLMVPDYGDTTGVSTWRSYAAQACDMGFTRVIYGVTAITTGITSANTAAFATAMAAEATWAQALGKSNLTLELGNEEELHHDGSLTDAQVRANMRSAATTCKAIYTVGGICYASSNIAGAMDSWISEGKGSFDRIGFNIYDDPGDLLINATKLKNAFGSNAFASEWNRPNSFSQTLGYDRDALQVAKQLEIFKGLDLEAYFFTFMYNGTYYGILRSDGTFIPVWPTLLETRRWLA